MLLLSYQHALALLHPVFFNLQCSVAWHGIEVVPQLVIS